MNSRLVCAVALGLALSGAGYVHREAPGQRRAYAVVEGSRDRHLHGKARVRARRGVA